MELAEALKVIYEQYGQYGYVGLSFDGGKYVAVYIDGVYNCTCELE